MRLQHQEFELYADYNQFYLWDSGTNPQAPEDYSDKDVQRRIKTGPHVVVIHPERRAVVPVSVEVHDADPPYNAEEWDHIAEASLHLATGRLQVHECIGGPAGEFTLAPGWYRVRSFHGDLGTVKGLDGNDRYRIVLWPAPPAQLAVIKQWDPRAPT